MVFKEVGVDLPILWDPEDIGETIEGTYVMEKLEVGKNKSNVFIIDVNGTHRSIWGSTVLNDKMSYCEKGDLIRITYEGKDPEKKYKKFKVERDKEDEKTV